jgi:hypothetical protein
MRLVWVLIPYAVCVGSDGFAAAFPDYFPLDPAIHGRKTFEWTYPPTVPPLQFESYISGLEFIFYRESPIDAAIIVNFGEWAEFYAANDGTFVWFLGGILDLGGILGSSCRYLADDCDLFKPASDWMFSSVSDDEIRPQVEWCDWIFCPARECDCSNKLEIVFDIQDVTVPHGRYDAAIIFWIQDIGVPFKSLNFFGKDADMGITLPTEALTRGRAVTAFSVYGRDIGLIAGGDIEANNGALLNLYELSDRSLSVDVFVGDANGDGEIDLADPVFALGYLFADGDPAACMKGADANNDKKIDISDVVTMLGYLFAGGKLILPNGDAADAQNHPGCSSYDLQLFPRAIDGLGACDKPCVR